MYPDALQMQPGHLLIKMLGQSIDIHRILLVEEFNLSQCLVGKTVAHNKTGMTCGATQIYQTTIGQKNDAVPVREEVTVHLRLHVLTLDARKFLEFVNLYLAVKVSDVTDNSLVRHNLEMLSGDYVDVAGGGYKYVALGSSLLHCHNLISLHCSLECAYGIYFCNKYARAI